MVCPSPFFFRFYKYLLGFIHLPVCYLVFYHVSSFLTGSGAGNSFLNHKKCDSEIPAGDKIIPWFAAI